MTTNELMGLAAHLHVLLRRKTGRVTDIEWMGVNPEYTQAVVQFAKAKAQELKDTDLELWALKLELANQNRAAAHKPLLHAAVDAVRANHSIQQTVAGADFSSTGGFRSSTLGGAGSAEAEAPAPMPPRYIGGIR